MSNNFKRILYSNFLVVLVIISNLVGIKFTNFSNLVISVNFVVFPFIYLFFLLISNIGKSRDAISTVLSAVFIQIFVLLIYIVVTNLGAQSLIPDFANYVNIVFHVDEIYIIINLIALMVSCFILQYIYEYFRVIRYGLLGTVISILSAIIVYGLITIPINNYGFGFDIIVDIMMGHLMMSVVMTILVTILFYLLKRAEYPYEGNNVFIKEINIDIPTYKSDKPIDEVIKYVEKKASKKEKLSRKDDVVVKKYKKNSRDTEKKKISSEGKKKNNHKKTSKNDSDKINVKK